MRGCTWPGHIGRTYLHDPAARVIDAITLASGQVGQQEVQTMKLSQSFNAALIIGAFLAALSGCQKQEGPAEKAGRQVDKAVEKVGQQIEKAGESVQDAAKGEKK
jgi:hypothetical protein